MTLCNHNMCTRGESLSIKLRLKGKTGVISAIPASIIIVSNFSEVCVACKHVHTRMLALMQALRSHLRPPTIKYAHIIIYIADPDVCM